MGYTSIGKDFEVVALPSREWTLESFDENGQPRPEDMQPVDTLGVGLVFFSKEALQAARETVARDTDHELFVSIGADIPFP